MKTIKPERLAEVNSSFAIDIINEQLVINDSDYMFCSATSNGPVSRSTIRRIGENHGQLLSGYGYVETRNHDVRRTARAAWERMQFPYRVAETMLGHKVHTGVQEHYNDYQYIDEQRECYKRWCDYIEAEVAKYEQENG